MIQSSNNEFFLDPFARFITAIPPSLHYNIHTEEKS